MTDHQAPNAAQRSTTLPPRVPGRPLRHLGLRARLTFAFALTGLLLSSTIAGATLALTRQNLLEERESSSFSVFVNNGRRVRNELTVETDDEGRRAIVERLAQTSGTFPLLRVGDSWTAADPLVFGSESVPGSVLTLTSDGTPARMRTIIGDSTVIVSALPIVGTGINATYFEAAPLDEVESTLEALTAILLGVAAVTTIIAASLGSWASQRLLKPLVQARTAAEALAAGELGTRLTPTGDTDLDSLAASFNEMAGALEDRIARDARFASAVSHELRSPLMTLAASMEVLANSASELGERGRIALDLLADDVTRFQNLVEDLLEINRYEAGTADLVAEPVDLADFVQRWILRNPSPEVGFRCGPGAGGTRLWADKRRLGQVLSNLVDNATKYGNGEVTVSVERADQSLLLGVEDNGPGVAPEERREIFHPFIRGRAGGRRGRDSGSGLGLALVAEHVSLHQGRVWVAERDHGRSGACFLAEFPISANYPYDDSTGDTDPVIEAPSDLVSVADRGASGWRSPT